MAASIPITGSSLTANINTEVNFVTNVGTAGVVPLTCPTILSSAKTLGLPSFLNTYKIGTPLLNNINTNLTTFKNTLDSAPNPSTDITQAADYTNIQEYITNVKNTQLPTLRLVAACLKEEVSPDATKLTNAELLYNQSKTRYESITDHRDAVSFYQGWFPLFRPMKEGSMFALFGISMLILITAILLLLQLTGIEVNIILPTIVIAEVSGEFGKYMPYIYGGGALGLLIVVIGVWRGWF